MRRTTQTFCRRTLGVGDIVAIVFQHFSTGKNSILLASEDSGVVCIEKATSTVVIETGAQVQQLSALEAFGLFLVRYDTGEFFCIYPQSETLL